MVEEPAERIGLSTEPKAERPDRPLWPNRALKQLARCDRVLMLQGPVGPFFHDLASLLQSKDVSVHKVNFNLGDVRFYPGGQWFRGALDQFADLLHEHVKTRRPQACLMFGQDRPVHATARRVLAELGVPVMVFEEGYVRPNFVTFEVGGVNSRSPFVWAPAKVQAEQPSGLQLTPQAPNFQLPFHCMANLAAQYHFLTKLGSPLYPEYQHHRAMGVLMETLAWGRAAVIKTWAPRHAHHVMHKLLSPGAPPYFLVPLQVHNDSQLQHHSGYTTIVAFIEDVLASFAKHAPPDAHLVFKHHPMNRGHRNYKGLLKAQVQGLSRHALHGRVHYLRDGHLPTLLQHAQGTVVINSTVGLSSMFHGTPVKTLGQALYDQPGLTFQGELDHFWRAPGTVDTARFQQFLASLVAQTQLPGSFYWPDQAYVGLIDAIGTALDRARQAAAIGQGANAEDDCAEPRHAA